MTPDSSFLPADAADPFEPMHALLAMLPADVRTNMVSMYREALHTQTQLLQDAVNGTDDNALRDLAHKIAGSAGMMQNGLLSRAARQMEIALREGRPDAARAAWPEVQSGARLTLAALQAG